MEWMLHGFLFAVGVAIGIIIMPSKNKKDQKKLELLLEEKNLILRGIKTAIEDINNS